MSADTDARKLERTSPRRQVFEHLVVEHAVRVDRKRYLPGLEQLLGTHARCHAGLARDSHAHAWDTASTSPELVSGTFEAVLEDPDGFRWVRAGTYSSDELDALVRERDRESERARRERAWRMAHGEDA